MFSYGEIFLTVAAAIALCGPKDVPVVARAAGRLVGRAVGYLQEFRGQVDTVIKRSQVDQVHKELQEAMAQLDAIRHEIRSGMSISTFGPLSRNIERSEVNRSFAASTSMQATQANQSSLAMATTLTASSKLAPGFSSVIESMRIQSVSDDTLGSIPPSTSRISAHRVALESPLAEDSAVSETSKTRADVYRDGNCAQDSSLGDVGHVHVLPISAASAGILPSRKGPVQGGADLLHESIVERTIAFDAKKFLQQSDVGV